MPVNLKVHFMELPVDARTQGIGEKLQNSSLRSIYDNDCLEILKNNLNRKEYEISEPDSRHFWYSGHFQPFENRKLRDVSDTTSIALSLCKDYYLISTWLRPNRVVIINPEIPLREALKTKKYIRSIFCYEIWDVHNNVKLCSEKNLYDQHVEPYYNDAAKPKSFNDLKDNPELLNKSHIELKMKPKLLWQAAGIILFMSALGALIGWSLGTFVWPHK